MVDWRDGETSLKQKRPVRIYGNMGPGSGVWGHQLFWLFDYYQYGASTSNYTGLRGILAKSLTIRFHIPISFDQFLMVDWRDGETSLKHNDRLERWRNESEA